VSPHKCNVLYTKQDDGFDLLNLLTIAGDRVIDEVTKDYGILDDTALRMIH